MERVSGGKPPFLTCEGFKFYNFLESQTFRRHWQRSETNASGIENRVAYRGRQANDRSFACAGRRNIFISCEHDFDCRNILETRHLIIRESGVENTAIFKLDRFEQSAADGHGDRAFDLILQVQWIYDGAAIERFDYAHDSNFSGLVSGRRPIDRDLRAGGNISVLFKAACDAEAPIARGFLFAPTKRVFAAASNTARRRSSLMFFKRKARGSKRTL